MLENLGEENTLRIAIVGIGNDLNGDDAAGVLVARALRGAQDPEQVELLELFAAAGDALPPLPGKERLLVIDAGPSPESFTGPLRRFAPDVVILIDAAQLGEEPGELRVFDWREAQGLSASTHTMPPSMLAEFLTAEIGCRVALIGIQAKSLEMDAPVSEEVKRAVVGLYHELRKALG